MSLLTLLGAQPVANPTFGDEYFAALEPWQNDSLQIFATAVGEMFEPVHQLVHEQGVEGEPGYIPGWSRLLDVDLCPTPYLPYLAQYVGVAIPTGSTDAKARALIRAEAGTQRGTLASIRSAVKRNLTGTQSVVIIERSQFDGTPDAYSMVIAIRPAEVYGTATWGSSTSTWATDTREWLTGSSFPQLQIDVNNVKPAGILIVWVISDGLTWAADATTYAADTSTWDQSALTP